MPRKLNPKITEFCYNLKSHILSLITANKQHNNLSKYEKTALKNLKNNKNIIIKKADKNSSIVVMNTLDYINKVDAMLSDTNVYTPVVIDDTWTVKLHSDDILRNIKTKGYINDKQFRYLTTYKPKIPVFYGIPKIHKKNNPLRPIVSQINGPTHKINLYIHELLETSEGEIPYLFKDTTAFLNFIEDYKSTPFSSVILVTMDVTSLYTNIPHSEAITYILEQYDNTLDKWANYSESVNPVDKDTLKILLEHMLSNCTFEFNNKMYKQNYGTPMGAAASVRIANIFMYKLLLKFLNSYNGKKPDKLGRLIDDIFFIWIYTEDEQIQFCDNLNAFHNTIKFELNYSTQEVNFLDTTVYVKNGTLHTKLYVKPTDKKKYLHFTSSHPRHIKKSIPFSQALRYRRIIDEESILKTEIDKLKHKFIRRDYPPDQINQQIDRIFTLERTKTLEYKSAAQKAAEFNRFTNNGPFLPIILTYKPQFCYNTENLYTVPIRMGCTEWDKFTNQDPDINNIFKNTNPQIVFKRGSTLANTLIRARYTAENSNQLNNTNTLNTTVDILAELDALNNPPTKTSKCSAKNCKLCAILVEDNSFTSTFNKRTHTITDEMSCNSINTIYLITCTKCKFQYVGETGRTLRERFNNHRSDIKLCKKYCNFHTL